jgi:hypothetical protein
MAIFKKGRGQPLSNKSKKQWPNLTKLRQVLKKSLTSIADPKKLGLFQFIQEHETFGKGWLLLH